MFPVKCQVQRVHIDDKFSIFLRFQRSPLISHKQSLPPYPHIECIVSSPDADLLKSLNYKIVKHGNYEFLASTDGYVQMYTQGYVNSREFDSKAGFAVYFGLNHPLSVHLFDFHL